MLYENNKQLVLDFYQARGADDVKGRRCKKRGRNI